MFEQNHIQGNDEVLIKIPRCEKWTISQLRYCCKKHKIKGYNKMNKDQLVREVKEILKN